MHGYGIRSGVGNGPWSWVWLLCGRRGDSWPSAGRINTTAATGLDSKAALGFPIPVNPMAENTTIDIGSGEEPDPSSWDQILFYIAGLSPGHCFNEFMPLVVALDIQQFTM